MTYWLSTDGERFSEGPFETRKQAHAYAFKNRLGNYWVGAKEKVAASQLWSADAERVAEQVGLIAADKYGEIAEDYPDLSEPELQVLQDCLDEAIRDFLSKVDVEPTFFMIANSRKYPVVKLEPCECDGWAEDDLCHRIETGHHSACPHFAASAVIF